MQKKKIIVEKPHVGRHTTFEAKNNDPNCLGTMMIPITVAQNIDVIVMP